MMLSAVRHGIDLLIASLAELVIWNYHQNVKPTPTAIPKKYQSC